jgi:hypothetical protein
MVFFVSEENFICGNVLIKVCKLRDALQNIAVVNFEEKIVVLVFVGFNFAFQSNHAFLQVGKIVIN